MWHILITVFRFIDDVMIFFTSSIGFGWSSSILKSDDYSQYSEVLPGITQFTLKGLYFKYYTVIWCIGFHLIMFFIHTQNYAIWKMMVYIKGCSSSFIGSWKVMLPSSFYLHHKQNLQHDRSWRRWKTNNCSSSSRIHGIWLHTFSNWNF
jgi:hypothetical protein